MPDTDAVYTRLQQHLDKQAVGFAATMSGVVLRILKELFTVEQAKLALHLSFEPQTVADIHRSASAGGISIETAKRLLDGMVDNGSIGIMERGGIEYYHFMPLLIGMVEWHGSKSTPQFWADFNEYLIQGYGKTYATTRVSQMRTIPVQKSITAEHRVTTYDHVREIVNNTEGRIGISPCMCREGARRRGETCKVTDRLETCMCFGDSADHFIKLRAREITREEALEIIRQNEEDGLVLQPTNYRNLDFICSCCGCCCGVLTTAKKQPRPARFFATNYYARIETSSCTGCGACVNICPVKDKADEKRKAINLEPQAPLREEEAKNWDFFLKIPDTDPKLLNLALPKVVAMKQPLFEFSGACAGCGETPYIKLMSQLVGDRAIIGNATGCTSIYGGNLPTTPYATRPDGRGPAWSNSLFEDAAEFGYGMRLSADKKMEYASELLAAAKGKLVDAALADRIMNNSQATDADIEAQRAAVAELKAACAKSKDAAAVELASVAEDLIKRSVWIFGGDGWAYDIGFGGLDHVLAAGKNVNALVLDTEVYSNTGGQASKSTPFGAVAKFATAGKDVAKKDLGAIAMSYGYVYVASVNMGANMSQCIKAFREAESYDGPSIIIAYSHCAMHGIDMMKGMNQQKLIAESGMQLLYRYYPRLKAEGKNPFQFDSREPDYSKIEQFMYAEVRFKTLKAANPARAAELLAQEKAFVERRYKEYKYLSERTF